MTMNVVSIAMRIGCVPVDNAPSHTVHCQPMVDMSDRKIHLNV
jgi:hypothetical protein